MKRHFLSKFGFLLTFMSLLPYACASQVDIYRKEANEYCELHNPKYWKNRNNQDFYSNMNILGKRIREKVKSPEFLAIFKQLKNTPFVDTYKAIQPKISKLIGEPWQCQYAKAFYEVKFVHQLNAPLPKGEKLVVTVQADRSIVLKGKTYKNGQDAAYLKSLKQAFSKTKNIEMTIRATLSKAAFKRLLEPLYKLGVKQLEVEIINTSTHQRRRELIELKKPNNAN